MIKAVHIEDEPRNIELLKELLQENCPEVKLMGHARDIPEALKLIEDTSPDLLYLDIELNKGNAFDLLDQLKDSSYKPHIIFITAFDEYAARAFRHNAIDYLLKPISITELKEATLRVSDKMKVPESHNNIFEVLKELRQSMGSQKIGLPVTDGVVFVNMEDIIRCEAKGGYSIVYLANKKNITSAKTMKELEEILTAQNFVRVHNSWIINTKYLKKYYRGKNSYIEMDDGSTVSISMRKKTDLLSFLKDFE